MSVKQTKNSTQQVDDRGPQAKVSRQQQTNLLTPAAAFAGPTLPNALAEHSTTRSLRQAAVLQMQQTHGNVQVLRTVITPSTSAGRVTKNAGGPQVQKDPVSAAALGVAVFEAGRSYANSGKLYHNGNTPSYMHEGTPPEAQWENVLTELRVRAWHPRIGWGNQNFYYRLTYQRNGYDIRNAQVDILRDKSSGMYTSTFGSTWSGQPHSRPSDRVAEIVFNISGEWDPHGRGHVSWWGQLILSAQKGGASFRSFTVGSERDWVWKA